jgi:hypothetical protein
MNCLPSEIWYHIFAYACSDGGRTGCALAAVSRNIRDASAPTRYQSIALSGARQIRAFIALQNHRPLPEWRGQEEKEKVKAKNLDGVRGVVAGAPHRLSDPIIVVRNLFLADCVNENSGTAQAWYEWKESSKASGLSKLVLRVKDMYVGRRNNASHAGSPQDVAIKSAEIAVNKLLSSISSTLEHLCLDQTLSSTLHYVPVALPMLKELTCIFRFLSKYKFSGRTSFNEKLPVLERLHVITLHLNQDIVRLALARDLPPSLTFVRFSDVVFPVILLVMLARPESNPWTSQTRTQEALRITMSRVPEPVFESDADLERYIPSMTPEHHRVHRLMRWQEPSDADQDVMNRVYVVEESASYDLNRLYREWLARLDGGEGCWEKGLPLSMYIRS